MNTRVVTSSVLFIISIVHADPFLSIPYESSETAQSLSQETLNPISPNMISDNPRHMVIIPRESLGHDPKMNLFNIIRQINERRRQRRQKMIDAQQNMMQQLSGSNNINNISNGHEDVGHDVEVEVGHEDQVFPSPDGEKPKQQEIQREKNGQQIPGSNQGEQIPDESSSDKLIQHVISRRVLLPRFYPLKETSVVVKKDDEPREQSIEQAQEQPQQLSQQLQQQRQEKAPIQSPKTWLPQFFPIEKRPKPQIILKPIAVPIVLMRKQDNMVNNKENRAAIKAILANLLPKLMPKIGAKLNVGMQMQRENIQERENAATIVGSAQPVRQQVIPFFINSDFKPSSESVLQNSVQTTDSTVDLQVNSIPGSSPMIRVPRMRFMIPIGLNGLASPRSSILPFLHAQSAEDTSQLDSEVPSGIPCFLKAALERINQLRAERQAQGIEEATPRCQRAEPQMESQQDNQFEQRSGVASSQSPTLGDLLRLHREHSVNLMSPVVNVNVTVVNKTPTSSYDEKSGITLNGAKIRSLVIRK